MRHVRTWTAMVVAAVLMAACADAPTLPREAEAVRDPSSENQAPQGCVIDGYCVLPPISGGGCDPHLELDWSCDDGGGDCMSSQPDTGDSDYGLATCPPPGTGPGPGAAPLPTPTEPPPSEPADTCNTGDPIVDDPDVTHAVQSLWSQSNPDANLAQRVEKAGWIVEEPLGQFSIMQWTGGIERFGCGDYPAQASPGKGRIVGFIHTHPYQVDEIIVDCNLRSVQRYDGGPSDVDRRTSQQLGQALGLGAPLPGYIIDKDGYYRFDGQGNSATPRRQRCGY